MSRASKRIESDKFVLLHMPVGKWAQADKHRFIASASIRSILPSPSIPVIASRFAGLKRRPIRNYFGMRRSVIKDFEYIIHEVIRVKMEVWEARFG